MTDDTPKSDAQQFIASATLDPLALLNMRNNHAGLSWNGNLLAESTGGVAYQRAHDKEREMEMLREYFLQKRLAQNASAPSFLETQVRNGISYAYKYLKDMGPTGQPGVSLSNSFTNAQLPRSVTDKKNDMEPPALQPRDPAFVMS